MAGIERKIKRNALKKHLGTNKIKDYFHEQNDPLWKRLQRGMKNARKGDKNK